MTNPVLLSLQPRTGGGTSTGSNDLEVPADASPGDWRHFFENHGCSFTRVMDPRPDPLHPEWLKSVLSFICLDQPGQLAEASRWLHDRYGANIVSSFGGRLDNNIHGSFFTILISPRQADRILHEVQMHRCDQIKVCDPPNRDNLKIYELSITARDRRSLFADITDLLIRDDRNINILSHGILTKEFDRSPGIPFAQIHLRLEVPLEMIPRLPEVIEEIRSLGRKEGWHVVDREWTGDRGSARMPMLYLDHPN